MTVSLPSQSPRPSCHQAHHCHLLNVYQSRLSFSPTAACLSPGLPKPPPGSQSPLRSQKRCDPDHTQNSDAASLKTSPGTRWSLNSKLLPEASEDRLAHPPGFLLPPPSLLTLASPLLLRLLPQAALSHPRTGVPSACNTLPRFPPRPFLRVSADASPLAEALSALPK